MTFDELKTMLKSFPEDSEVELKLGATHTQSAPFIDYTILDMHVRSWKINNKEGGLNELD